MGKTTKLNNLCLTDRLFHESDLATVHTHIQLVDIQV